MIGVTGATQVGGIPVQGFTATRYYAITSSSDANAVPTQSTLYYTPFWVPVGHTFDRIACVCQTVAASSFARLGIYTDVNGLPASLVLDAGQVGTSVGTGKKEITISQALNPGSYWLAYVSQGGAPTLLCNGANRTTPMMDVTNPASGAVRWGISEASVTGAMPSTASASPSDTNQSPYVWLRA